MTTPEVGSTMPPHERTIAMTDMIAYAGATWDWHKLHYDPVYLAEHDLPGPVIDGQMFGALLASDLEQWLGPDCFISELAFTYRNLMYGGERLVTTATIDSVDGDEVHVQLTATILTSEFGPERAAVQPATATVRVGAADGPGR